MKLLSRVQLLATPWTAAYQAPPSMGFSRQEYWSGVPLLSSNLVAIIHYYPFHPSYGNLLSLWVCLFWTVYVNRIIQCVVPVTDVWIIQNVVPDNVFHKWYHGARRVRHIEGENFNSLFILMKVINKRSDLKITTAFKKNKNKTRKTDLWQICNFKISYLHRTQKA